MCEPIFERPLKDISFGHLLVRLFQTARRFDMEVQPQLVLLQKTLLNIEGLGRQLYPELDLWQTAKPFLEQWVRERVGTKAMLRELQNQAPRWGEMAPALPGLIYDVLRHARDGRIKVDSDSRGLKEMRREIKRANQRLIFAVAGASFIVSSALLMGLDGYFPTMLGGVPIMSWVLGLLGLYLLLVAWPSNHD